MDAVFKALADPGRRALLDRLRERGGQTLGELCQGMDMARQSVSKHLAVLEAADLVVTERRGREKLHRLNAAPVTDIVDRWVSRYHQPRAHALADLKHVLEEPLDDNDFVYMSYIRATPEQVWDALTRPEFTRRYWDGTELVSTWEQGARVSWDGHEDAGQVVLESDRPRLLSYTWHTFTPAWAEHVGVDEELRAKLAAEPRTRATFAIEQVGELVKLTVTHSGFEPGSTLRGMVGEGWPHIVSSLKSLLETGSPLPLEQNDPFDGVSTAIG
ncbi:ArsR/SmtB family transcription factor [Actinokineospora pegani]|uniref:ArsR/SmtB family transcription factor n=1 Tax=Actinokineospora pegani TaxID=2654637 RepID=UPI0012E992EE|nr:metalloregulator ArsR/SmtB family transcription factor [Actinokineospora pegani]